MKIAILGTGNIGGTLGKKWAKAGHTIHYGARDTHKESVQSLVKAPGGNVTVSSIADAINFGEVVVFAIPGAAMTETIEANAKALNGKVIIDSANNVGGPSMNSFATFAVQTPKAKVFRAFNIYGWENFENPTFGSIAADLFYCGPDGEANAMVARLISDVGLVPVSLGGPQQVELVDSLLRLWFTLSRAQKSGRNFAFKVLTH